MNPIFSKKSFWGGLLFIAAGIVLLMQNFNLLPFVLPAYVFTWKMLLVAIGVFVLPSRNWFGGLVLICTGTYFLLPEAFGIHNVSLSQLWPLGLIAIGLLIINNKLNYNNNHHKFKKKITINMEKSKDGYIENTVIFGSDSKKISSYDFKGGHISVICGGLEMDLTNCTLSKSENVIDIEIVMGGLSLTVPREWNIRSEAVPIMGGVEDDITEHKDKYVDPAAELIIRGNVVMGGLEIKRA
jgi:predicted membrane protein